MSYLVSQSLTDHVLNCLHALSLGEKYMIKVRRIQDSHQHLRWRALQQ